MPLVVDTFKAGTIEATQSITINGQPITGGGGLEDITYTELYNKTINGLLIPGQWYRLTDYKSVNFLNGLLIADQNPTPTDPNFNPREIYTGETEVLLLQATTESEISYIGYSETYVNDIIEYIPYTNKIGIYYNIRNGQGIKTEKSPWEVLDNLTSLSQLDELNYTTFYTALGNQIGNYVVGEEMIMKSTVSGNFYKIIFTSWTQGNAGGGFSYDRQLITLAMDEPVISFTKTDYGSEVDIIEAGVLEITRGNNQPIYNSAVEANSNGENPANTEWASSFFPISGFDLQWDGTNVYFNMPTGYPVYFGQSLYLYCEFDGGSYFQDGAFFPTKPHTSLPFISYTSDDPDVDYPIAMSRIKIEDNGTKVILLDLTETDYLNYDLDTLSIYHINPLGDAYGAIIRRQDLLKNIDVPFDFRGIKYRRFEVDLSSINSSLGIGYWGIGDDFFGQGTTGNYKDFKVFTEEGFQVFDIKWNGSLFSESPSDNVVFLRNAVNITLGIGCSNNTMDECYNSRMGNYFEYNVINYNFYDNIIGDYFSSNLLGNEFAENTIGIGFRNNNIDFSFKGNKIGDFFDSNTIGVEFLNNIIDGVFNSNTIGDNFQVNKISRYFYNNTIGSTFQINQTEYDIDGYDFTSATYVYGNYNCKIFKNSAGFLRLSYIDGADTVQYVAIND